MDIDMKKILLLFSVFTLLVLSAPAQTQTGYVKTKGRFVNGKHVPGQGLTGATVHIKGRTSVLVKNSNGLFSFPVPSNRFVVQSVRKNGYQLVDADAAPHTYVYSTAPIFLVMETPAQLLEDKLASERQLRRTLTRQLQKREDEIEALKQENRITQEQYNNTLQQLYDQQQSNEKLIAEMADFYSKIDYDQIDEFNRRVSELILAGELARADSLLRSKGNMDERISKLNEHHDANVEMREMLEKSESAEQLTREDLARDCFSFFRRFVLDNETDSAICYIEKRASLDAMNSQWQADAGSYLQQCGLRQRAVDYFRRAIESARTLAKEAPEQYEPLLATTLNDIAILYAEAGDMSQALSLFDESHALFRRLAQADSLAYLPNLASALNNQAVIYSGNAANAGQVESLLTEALDIYRYLSGQNPEVYAPFQASVMNNLGLLYDNAGRIGESENMFEQALDLYRKIGSGTTAYERDYAVTLNNLAALLFKNGNRLGESRLMLTESLDIYRRLAADEPLRYGPMLAAALNNLSVMDFSLSNSKEGEEAFAEALDIYRNLLDIAPLSFLPFLARGLYDQAIRYYQDDNLEKSESLFRESLDGYRSLGAWDAGRYMPEVAKLLRNLANVCDKRQHWDQAGELYQEELTINERLTASNPDEYASHLARTYGNLANHAILAKNFSQAAEYARQGLAIDQSRLFIQANLAAALLFMGETSQAEKIYRKYKNELRDVFMDDFSQFESLGIIPREAEQAVKSIKQILQQ